MIGYLNGVVRYSRPPIVMLDVNGIGYEVCIPASAFLNLPEVGERVELHTHVATQNDTQTIYGFFELGEREAFRVLISVNGVGPRSALSLLSEITLDELASCVQLEDARTFTKVPGIGAKTAGRLILELRDKLDGIAVEFTNGEFTSQDSVMVRDVVDALTALGFGQKESNQVVLAIRSEFQSVEQGLRMALSTLGAKSH